MIRPDLATFRAALAGVRAAEGTRRLAQRALGAGELQRGTWLARQVVAWEDYIAAIADEAIHEAATSDATCCVTPAANGHPDVPQAVTPASPGVQSGTESA